MNLMELAKSKGTNLKKVAEQCGIPPTTLYAISRGDTNFDNVGIGIVMKVANALDMTVDELYTGKPSIHYAVVSIERDDDERELVELFRSMQPEHRALLMDNARAFAALSEKDSKVREGAVGYRAVDVVR